VPKDLPVRNAEEGGSKPGEYGDEMRRSGSSANRQCDSKSKERSGEIFKPEWRKGMRGNI